VNIAASPETPVVAGSTTLESSTRERVLAAISERGPITAATLAEDLGLTAPAVRRHLENLADAGLIAEREPATTSRGRGRPARSYVISDAGHQALDSDYDHLATEALRFLAAEAGDDAVRRFAETRVAALEERYAAELATAGDDPSARVDALVAALTRDGFAASARPVGDPAGGSRLTGIQLCQGHCPVQHAAREFPAFCDAETDAFSRLLGVHVQRLATLAHGDHVCTTFVPTTLNATQTTTKADRATERSSR
jgi:predicted ArsR family transcriptional regulator